MSPSSGNGGGDRGERHAVVGQVLVDLVGDHPQALGRGPLADLRDLLRRVDGAGRVGRGDEEQDLGAVREGRFQLLHGDQVALLRAGEDLHRHAAGQPDGLRVGGPERGGDNDLVARIQQGGEGVVDGLLAAVGHQHLGRLGLVAGVPEASCPRWPASARAGRRRGSSGGTSAGWRPRWRPARCSPGSGSRVRPAPKPMTGRPAAFSAFALASTARVADSAMAEMRWEMRAADMGGSVLRLQLEGWMWDSTKSTLCCSPDRPGCRTRKCDCGCQLDFARHAGGPE